MITSLDEFFAKSAKALLKAVRARDPEALTRVGAVFHDVRDASDEDVARRVRLGRAQHVIAREYGYESWDGLLSRPPLEQRFVVTLAKHPNLNAFGIGLYGRDLEKPEDEQARILRANREHLRQTIGKVGEAVDWLTRNYERADAINRDTSSYGLKHRAEADIGYITNGALITAALIAGFPCEESPPNAFFGIRERRRQTAPVAPPTISGWVPEPDDTSGSLGVLSGNILAGSVLDVSPLDLSALAGSVFDNRPIDNFRVDLDEPDRFERDLQRAHKFERDLLEAQRFHRDRQPVDNPPIDTRSVSGLGPVVDDIREVDRMVDQVMGRGPALDSIVEANRVARSLLPEDDVFRQLQDINRKLGL